MAANAEGSYAFRQDESDGTWKIDLAEEFGV